MLSFLFIEHDVFDFVKHFIVASISLSVEEEDESGVNLVVVDNLGHLWEVPGEPLLQAHAEGVDVLVHLLNEGNGLSNWFVSSVDILRDLGAGEGMTEIGRAHV